MSPRKALPDGKNFRATRHAAAPRNASGRSSTRRNVGAFTAPKAEGAALLWRCLLSSIAVAVASLAPLRNLTGDADQQHLLDAFTNDLAADLTGNGREAAT